MDQQVIISTTRPPSCSPLGYSSIHSFHKTPAKHPANLHPCRSMDPPTKHNKCLN